MRDAHVFFCAFQLANLIFSIPLCSSYFTDKTLEDFLSYKLQKYVISFQRKE